MCTVNSGIQQRKKSAPQYKYKYRAVMVGYEYNPAYISGSGAEVRLNNKPVDGTTKENRGVLYCVEYLCLCVHFTL